MSGKVAKRVAMMVVGACMLAGGYDDEGGGGVNWQRCWDDARRARMGGVVRRKGMVREIEGASRGENDENGR